MIDMSTSKWSYTPEKCDGKPCIGDCDICQIACDNDCEHCEWDDCPKEEATDENNTNMGKA